MHHIGGNPPELAVTHLNASIGPVLTVEQLAAALRSGTLAAIDVPLAAAAAAYLFVELNPSLILACAHAAGSDLNSANMLYRGTLAQHLPRVAAWENAVEDRL